MGWKCKDCGADVVGVSDVITTKKFKVGKNEHWSVKEFDKSRRGEVKVYNCTKCKTRAYFKDGIASVADWVS